MRKIKREDMYLLRKEFASAGYTEDSDYIEKLFSKH